MQEFGKDQVVEVHERNNWERGKVTKISRDSQWNIVSYRVTTRFGISVFFPWEIRQASVAAGVVQ